MQRFRFPIAVVATSLVLVFGLVAIGGVVAGSVLAFGPPWAGGLRGGPPWAGGHGFGPAFALPPELAGLQDLPADQRFGHFKAAQVRLTDRDGNPLTIDVTPGVATAVSATSLTLTANDGLSKTFSLNDATTIRGKDALAQNDQVVVVTFNGSSTAHAVMALAGDGGGPWSGAHGWRSR